MQNIKCLAVTSNKQKAETNKMVGTLIFSPGNTLKEYIGEVHKASL